MSHVFLPSDPRLKRLATEIEEERNHALVLEPAGEPVAERGERAEAGEAFQALWSSARRDDEVLQTTQPGDALQLFAEPAPPADVARAGGVHDDAGRAAAPVEPETAFEKRERLRAERHALVATLARRTGEEHRTVNARVNREVGALSVNKSTDEQLEKANRLLEREVLAAALMAELPALARGNRRRPDHGRRRAARDPGLDGGPPRSARRSPSRSGLRRESLARLRADPRCALDAAGRRERRGHRASAAPRSSGRAAASRSCTCTSSASRTTVATRS